MIFNKERLISARKMSGLSLQDLSDKLTESGHQITKQALSQYEQGRTKPNLDMFFALLKALNIKLDYFITTGELKLEFGKLQCCNFNGRYY